MIVRTRHLLRGFVLLLVVNGLAPAQSPRHTPAFLSVGFGPFWSDHSGFTDTYGSGPVLVGSVGGGVPLVQRLHLYGKVMYVARRSVDATSEFQQWFFDAGLQYGLPVLDNMTVAFQGGAAFSAVSEETHEADGSSSSVHGGGIQGVFVGVGAERPLERSRWAVFAEIQYNTSRSDASSIVGQFGGSSISLGLRYRFLNVEDSKKDDTSSPSIWGH